MQPSKWHFELWSPGGQLLADLSGRATGRRITLSRNEAEDIQWRLDLNEFERYARLINVPASSLLVPGATEVRIRRGQVYICGGQLTYIEPQISDTQQIVDVKAAGFLNLFDFRETTGQDQFTAVERTSIATQLITWTQSVDAYSDFGVTIGPNQATIGNYTVLYQNQTIKQVIQDLSKLQAGFDFEFTYDKKFNTYAAIGSKRPELIFEYPGNVKSLRAPLDATGLANRIYLYGAGFGDLAASQITVDDTGSEASYKVREKNVILNATLDSGTLQDYGNSQLAAWAYPFEVPSLEVDGNRWPYLTDYHIGDYVTIRTKHPYTVISQLNSLFRIEKIEISIDEEDGEAVTLGLGR